MTDRPTGQECQVGKRCIGIFATNGAESTIGLKGFRGLFVTPIADVVMLFALFGPACGVHEFYLEVNFCARVMGLGADAGDVAVLVENGAFVNFPNGFIAFAAPKKMPIAYAFTGIKDDFIVLI